MKSTIFGLCFLISFAAHADCDISAINGQISNWLKKPISTVKTVEGERVKGKGYASEIKAGTGLVNLNGQQIAITVFKEKFVWENGTIEKLLETQLTPIDSKTCEIQAGSNGVRLVPQP